MRTDERILERDSWRSWQRTHDRTDTPPPLRKMMTTTVHSKGVNPMTGMEQFTFIASTEAVDREGDVIFADGWDIASFMKNPVILFAHDYRSLPIGRGVAVAVKRKQLHITVDFTPEDVNPDGYRVYRLVQAGFLNAVSVGFNPRKYRYNDEHSGYDFVEAELLEVSVVPVPANQEALLAAGLLKRDTEEWIRRHSSPPLNGPAADFLLWLADLIEEPSDEAVNRVIERVLADRGIGAEARLEINTKRVRDLIGVGGFYE